jgi:hypothetical protein
MERNGILTLFMLPPIERYPVVPLVWAVEHKVLIGLEDKFPKIELLQIIIYSDKKSQH